MKITLSKEDKDWLEINYMDDDFFDEDDELVEVIV